MTTVLIDILEPDPVFGESSKEALRRCLRKDYVVACDIVWAEIATAYQTDVEALLVLLEQIGIGFSPLSQDSALAAARIWYAYREKGGTRRRIAADFLIGAHAFMQCDRLLSRDSGFFREYFSDVTLIVPTSVDVT
uniref:PIN domain-containing protein n=1 Tax=Candidatus Kentrum sp. FM TaxID=2126340 RepID=A0A450TC22_9GAMM|nr:MAG: hypothetical protein BECKFM1743A_GA0114220_103452 [Candidatus Kentron sp. FM]VFJ64420.1 MAG: hypothetical protein BECKFM1743C_GA0114222_103682 [Candidatus Kentron sp. FM]VFK15030.1 MAG: hypothetical protein BECKFM1743B_GA0114221_103504 [Candidatus Kentron sp. FM]